MSAHDAAIARNAKSANATAAIDRGTTVPGALGGTPLIAVRSFVIVARGAMIALARVTVIAPLPGAVIAPGLAAKTAKEM